MAERSGFVEEALPTKLNFSVWGKIFKYALRHWYLLVGSILLSLLMTFYDASFVPVMNAGAIKAAEETSFFLHESVWEVQIPVTFIFGIKASFDFKTFLIIQGIGVIIRSATIFFNFWMTNLISMHVMLDLRKDGFEKIQRLPFSYFDHNSSGWLISRLQGDTASLGDVIAWSLTSILWCLFELFFAIGTMFSVNPFLGLIVLSTLPIVIIVAPLFERHILKSHRTLRNASSYYTGYLSESISGSKTIKTLSIEDMELKEADEITEDIRKKRFKAIRAGGYLYPILTILSGATVALIIYLGNKRIVAGDTAITAATIVLFIGFTREIYDPLTSLAEIFSEFMASQAGAEKVMQLLEAPIEIADRPEIIEKYGDILHPKTETYTRFNGDIEFKDLRFSYVKDHEVIHPLNLKIKAGTSLAIVGETGSGKTTLVNLLCRFYEPSDGQILVDGTEYRDLSLGYLRSNIGYVQQTPFVFRGSYKDNISYGSRNASQEQIEDAAKRAGIHDFILSTKDGYDTVLEDGGASLSQGQKQLVSIARAMLRNPSILILDEATSSIDTETEKKVQAAVGELLKGRTSIVIAHRLSTIVQSDRILVMENGSVIEDGNHETLMKKKGKYFDLYMSQFQELATGGHFE